MAELSSAQISSAVHVSVQRLYWELRRAARFVKRRSGTWGFLVLACVGIALTAEVVRWRQAEALKESNAQFQQWVRTSGMGEPPSEDSDAQGIQDGLKAFDALLIEADDIPSVVQDLIDRAKGQGLSLPKGEYLSVVDPQGGFLRFQMVLPFKGPADAVPRFLVGALAANKSLALQSAQFSRDSGASQEVEVRLQLSLLTRLPPSTRRTSSTPDKKLAVSGAAP